MSPVYLRGRVARKLTQTEAPTRPSYEAFLFFFFLLRLSKPKACPFYPSSFRLFDRTHPPKATGYNDFFA